MFRGDGSRAQKLENRWNCLNSFVRGCSFDHLNPQGARMSLCSHNMKCVAILSLCLKACSSSLSQTVFLSIVTRCQLKD